eukprot:CAMPEP_0180303762 /NCGR_PEP_ID=MMETSP0988-20121125/25286_1 /TAXON_ID=697907 /ORGANISM="non described non described, Strain CCMP2293" /LENGTH=117 /DNA_ID=CAMNT_0022285591 /DNA_START=205 /DNA_END=558 /DNA_ORIENTATION=-
MQQLEYTEPAWTKNVATASAAGQLRRNTSSIRPSSTPATNCPRRLENSAAYSPHAEETLKTTEMGESKSAVSSSSSSVIWVWGLRKESVGDGRSADPAPIVRRALPPRPGRSARACA